MEVKIRPLRIEDAYISVNWRNDKDVFKYTGNTYYHEITLESELEWIERIIVKKDDYRCAILVDEVYVGNIYLTDISKESATYHIFIGNKEYWGKGVARKASELILHCAFCKLGLETVNLKVHKDNVSALSLYRKLGFKEKASDSTFICMELTNKDFIAFDTMIYDVTVISAEGDGTYLDFTFKIKNPDGQLADTVKYTLYPLHENRYPQKELVYTNYNFKKKLSQNCGKAIRFAAPMPDGYNVAYQITQNSGWVGLRGKLCISK